MARVSTQKRAELESFWRGHHEGWERSTLNQREYCALHGLPLKRFGNWRAQFMGEAAVAKSGLLYRRGGELRHMSRPMSDRDIDTCSTGYVPSGRALPGARRNFRLGDKKRIVDEAMTPGVSVSGVARRYGSDKPLLFRWKRELAPKADPVFVPVIISDGPDGSGLTGQASEALLVLESQFDAIDLIVTDYAMPHMSGIELIHRARAIRPGLPAVIVTGYADEALLGRRPGDVAVLSKPFSIMELQNAIEQAAVRDDQAAHAYRA